MRFTKRTSKALPRFWKYYDKMPPDIQRQAKRKFLQFLESPSSVEFKRLNVAGLPPYYSARINDGYRAIGYLKQGTIFGFGSEITTATFSSSGGLTDGLAGRVVSAPNPAKNAPPCRFPPYL